jgi:hypothetical protein
MSPKPWARAGLACLAAAACLLAAARPAAADDEVRICVVAILATDRNADVDERLPCIAKEVRKQEPSLTGFSLATINCKPVAVGAKETFALVDGKEASVVLQQGPDKDNRVRLVVKAPQVGEITYSTACGKYFPVVTGYQNKDKDRLIIAVMVKTCKSK